MSGLPGGFLQAHRAGPVWLITGDHYITAPASLSAETATGCDLPIPGGTFKRTEESVTYANSRTVSFCQHDQALMSVPLPGITAFLTAREITRQKTKYC